ncbi:MAG: hypothetical protein RQ899_10735 [Pseudomonadales bacterium]|nr:hypothetical protein [Pseudomonadales bacterium]
MNDFEKQLKSFKDLISKDSNQNAQTLTEIERVLKTIAYEDRGYRLPFSSDPVGTGERWKAS